MHLLLTILRRDLASWPRQPRFYLKRATLGAVFGVLVYITVLRGAAADATTAGALVFRHLTLVVALLACLLAPLAAGHTLAADRRSGAWTLLYLTDVRPGLLMLAKLLTALWRALTLLLAALPMFLLCVSLGGVAPVQILAALIGLASIVLLGVSIGLCGAVAARSEVQAVSLILSLTLWLFLILPAVTFVLATALDVDGAAWATRLSPVLGLRALTEGAPPGTSLVGAATATVLALVALAVTFLLTPRRMVATALAPAPRLPFMVRWLGRRPLLGSPVLWRDYHLVHGGSAPRWLTCLATCLVLVATLAGVQAMFELFDFGDLLRQSLVFCGTTGLLIYTYNFTIGAARMFQQERHDGTLELLLCTDLRETQILGDKLSALYRAEAPWLAPAAIGLGGYLWLADDWPHVGLLLGGALFLAVTWYAYAGLCLFLALRHQRQAEVLALTALALWLTVGLSLFAIVGGYLAIVGFLFGPVFCLGAPLLLGRWLRRLATENLRRYALAPTA